METFSKFESEQPALNNCERVPIHIPARVQSGVSLIAFQLADFKTVGCSENCQPMLWLSHEKILGLDMNDVFANRKIIHAIRGALSLPSIKLQRERIGRFTLQENGQDKFDIALSLGGDLGILEIEPVLGDADQAEAPVFWSVRYWPV